MGQVHRVPGETFVRWMAVILALFMLTLVPTPASAHECETVHLHDGTSVTTKRNDLGVLRICDTDHDGRSDEASLQTRPVPTESRANLVQDRDWTPSGQDEYLGAEVLVDTGLPHGPFVYADLIVEDHGDDEEIDNVHHTFEARVLGESRVFLMLFDSDGDGVTDDYGFQVCNTETGGCTAPSPRALPNVNVPRVHAPVLKVPFVGVVGGGPVN